MPGTSKSPVPADAQDGPAQMLVGPHAAGDPFMMTPIREVGRLRDIF